MKPYNPSVSTKTHRDIIVDHSSAMYMNVKLMVTFVKTVARLVYGSLLCSNKPCTTGVPREIDRYDSEVVENATVYSSELCQGCLPGDVKKALKCVKWLSSCSLSIQIAAGYRSVDFLYRIVQDQSTENI
jgi:hypothetical protein